MIASVALAGCSNKEKNNNEGSTTASGKEDAEQYLNLLLASEPKTIDQSKSSDLYSSQILANCQEALTRITKDENGQDKIEPGIAESWEQSEDGLKCTFKLRDAKWSDGQSITAEQFVYGIKRTLDVSTASPYAFLLYPMANAQEYNSGSAKAEDVGIKALDDKTVEFTLKSPCAYF